MNLSPSWTAGNAGSIRPPSLPPIERVSNLHEWCCLPIFFPHTRKPHVTELHDGETILPIHGPIRQVVKEELRDPALHLERAWKRVKLAQLSAQIRIEEAILRSLRSERAELVQLTGPMLRARFGWESPAELEFIYRNDVRFQREIEDLFIEAELRGTNPP